VGTVSFPGAKRPGHGLDHPPPSSAEVKERVDLYLYSPSVIGWILPLLYLLHAFPKSSSFILNEWHNDSVLLGWTPELWRWRHYERSGALLPTVRRHIPEEFESSSPLLKARSRVFRLATIPPKSPWPRKKKSLIISTVSLPAWHVAPICCI